MSVCVSGPLLRGSHFAPLSRAADAGPLTTSVQQRLNERTVTIEAGNGPGRQVAFAQSDRHHLFITADRIESGIGDRQLRVHLIDGDGLAERFTGRVESSVFSLASTGGALMIGMLNDREITGSLVFPDGRAHRFAAEFSPVG